MRITFLGAAKTVTGSCFFIETESTKFLVDCGMFQGNSKIDALNEEDFPFNPAELDYIFLTHAHIDHSGRIPRIFVKGFKGEIITTKATAELCTIMLPDSGHIQESENEWINRKRARAGKPPVEPLYTYKDAFDSLKLLRSVSYGNVLKINNEIRVRFNDAGHILGSAIIEMWIVEKGEETKIVFTGDLGNNDVPILRDPAIIENADYLVIESTYGNRHHQENEDRVEKFLNIVNETLKQGGNVVIPSFAVGRTQALIYELNKKKEVYDERLKLFETLFLLIVPWLFLQRRYSEGIWIVMMKRPKNTLKMGTILWTFGLILQDLQMNRRHLMQERKESSIIISASECVMQAG